MTFDVVPESGVERVNESSLLSSYGTVATHAVAPVRVAPFGTYTRIKAVFFPFHWMKSIFSLESGSVIPARSMYDTILASSSLLNVWI